VLAAKSGWASKRKLLTAFIDYPFRAPEVIGSLIQPTDVLGEWASAAAHRRVVTTAGADAHARLALRGADPADGRLALPLPGYETAFHVMSVHVRTERPLSGDAGSDGVMLARALRSGHLYTALDSLASPPSFEFTAANAKGTVQEGEELGLGGAVQLRVQSNAPPEFQVVVYQDHKAISSVKDAPDLIVHASDRPAVYWVEIVDASHEPPLTWIRGNAIYVRAPSADRAPTDRPKAAALAVFTGRSAGGWSVEHDPMSAGAVEVASDGSGKAGGELRFRYGLAGGAAVGQVTALLLNTPTGIGSYDRLTFSGRSERPVRVSVQLRDEAAHRWHRSVYLDPAPREVTLAFADFLPISPPATGRPSLPGVRTIMFVVDTTNTLPGSSGRIWIRSAALEKLATSAR
jgi:hypothetical protein